MSKSTTPDGSEMVTPVKIISSSGLLGIPGTTLIGLSSGGDFTTAYASVTTITLGTAPYTHTYITADIIAVQQYDSTGECVATYTITDTLFSISASVLTVTGATFVATDTFIVITNIPRSQYSGNSTSDAEYVRNTRLNPDWAHISNEQPFNAQAADGSSTGYDVSSYKSLGFSLVDAVCDGVLTIEDSDGTPLEFMLDGVLMWSYTCPASGTNKHPCKIVNCNPHQTIFVLTGRTTGSISIKTLYQY